MNRKSLILCLVAAAVMLCGITLAVLGLYSGKGKAPARHPSHAVGILEAVPSDAAMIATFSSGDELFSVLSDSTNASLQLLTDPQDNSVRTFLKSFSENAGMFRGHPAAVSLHFSGSLIPLFILSGGSSLTDSTASVRNFLAYADSAGLSAQFLNPGTASEGSGLFRESLVLVSKSRTIINSAVRHISDGTSVLESEDLLSLVQETSSDNAVYICNRYSGKILVKNFNRRYSRYADFFSSLGDWTAFRVERSSEGKRVFSGKTAYSDDVSHYLNVLEVSAAESKVAQTLPASVSFVLDIPVSNIKSYVEAYDKYLDAYGKLKNAKKEKDWAYVSDIKEVALAYFHVGKALEPVVLLRTGKQNSTGGKIMENTRSGYPSTIFGQLFALPDESSVVGLGDWTVIGSAGAVNAFTEETFLANTLKDMLSDCGLTQSVPDKCGMLVYYSMNEDPTLIDNVFSKDLAAGLRTMAKGVSNVPILAKVEADGKATVLGLEVTRMNLVKSKAPVVERDTVVVVPKGPFKVLNGATGESNMLLQQPNMYLVLQEMSGKGIWGIPFKTPLCGRVESVDYYNNGKIQFLFASTSKLYLLDRLGRFVKGFPVELGKEVLLGPDVYDFTGAKGYRVMVLHKDNSLELYNLHGQKPEGWKGIKAPQTVKNLPELIEAKGRRYWVVRTSVQTLIYPFEGGEALTKFEGQKMIRPDSGIAVDGASVKVTCYDGKERNIKL